MALLDVGHLTMHYTTKMGDVHAVDDVSFEIDAGEAIGLVGESGCGKTSVAMSLMKLLPDNARILGGKIVFDGLDLVPLPEDEVRKIRWKGISMVFQAAMNSLNPVYRVGDQIIEAIQQHLPLSIEEARAKVAKLYTLVGMDPKLMDRYPHEYSGGMKQRAVIAMALACDPKMIIADEPTTALDVIVQDRILHRIDEIRKELNMAMMYISHDIAVIAEVSDVIGVMYAGRLVELADTVTIFKRPVHPYTIALMSAFPSIKGEKRPLVHLPGEPPDLLNPPQGCRFHPRCRYATAVCQEQVPQYRELEPGHYVACWNPQRKGGVDARA
ncbi:MAG: Oligopeptide transport ATP-binding protein OppD [Acetothermia bacterium 64_32]|nr:MAG: Oligopeptide transport ATP-binding protein OppD [Acetothermia bacterium 64_32]MBC7098473.1 ABC transporter ATP-binding protein [Candidatus Bipolaricaulota bacterium]HAF70023.1 dipeptide/oligopeptide/nickel ABC transporter ATP-binding protein [Candidatus Acetothermia bacterium]